MKRLYRKKEGRKVFGVLAGLSEYFNWEPTLVRLIFVLVAIFSGFVPAIIAYALAWLIVDEEPIDRLR